MSNWVIFCRVRVIVFNATLNNILILVFDTVKTNVGNGYNRYSGMFTAPLSGLYALACSITMDGTNAYASYVQISLIQNLLNAPTERTSHGEVEHLKMTRN
jgi:hypothetical protein